MSPIDNAIECFRPIICDDKEQENAKLVRDILQAAATLESTHRQTPAVKEAYTMALEKAVKNFRTMVRNETIRDCRNALASLEA